MNHRQVRRCEYCGFPPRTLRDRKRHLITFHYDKWSALKRLYPAIPTKYQHEVKMGWRPRPKNPHGTPS